MKTTARRYQIASLLTLLALAAFTIYAQRVVTTARGNHPNITWGQALAAAFAGKPAPTSTNHKRSNSNAPASAGHQEPDESATTTAQSGGGFDINNRTGACSS